MTHTFREFLLMGLTSFGGPVAHLAYFHRRFAEELAWLSAERYASLMALCQALPGPSSSQMCFMIGVERGGLRGGALAWAGFVLPTFILLTTAGMLSAHFAGAGDLPVAGLKAAAAGVVIHALWQMARRFCLDMPSVGTALITGAVIVLVQHPLMVPAVVLTAVAAGWWFVPGHAEASEDVGLDAVPRRRVIAGVGVAATVLAVSLLLGAFADGPEARLIGALGQGGALVFGGGHVVLPLLEAYVVPEVMDRDLFLAGYGLAQAVPGPMFTLSAYLGAVTGGPLLAIAALATIFLPGFALVWGLAPLWDRFAAGGGWSERLHVVNATVVGLVGAALYDLVLPAALTGPVTALAVAATAAGLFLRIPVWLLVITVGLVVGAIEAL